MDKKKKKILIISAAILLVVVIVYFVFFRKPKIETDFEKEIDTIKGNNGIVGPSTNLPSAPAANDSLPLQLGSKGQRVINVQNAVNKINPLAMLTVDGDFGSATRNALITFVGSKFYPINSTLYLELMQKAAAI